MPKHQKAIIALIIANIIWGAASPIFKWSLTNVEPFTLAFLRFAFAAILLYPLAKHSLYVAKKDWVKLLILSLAGITFNISFFFFGLKLAPSINAPIIATAGPIFLLICCLFFLKEKLRPKIAIGTAIGFLGVLFIILRPIFENGFNLAVLGNLFFVLATAGAVIHTVFLKKLAPRYHPLTIAFWSFFIGSVSFLPFFYFEVQKVGFLPNLELPGLFGILFGIFLCSALAYYLYDWAIKQLYAQEVGVFAYLDPIIAIIIAIPLLGEIPTPTYLLGALFVFAGIFIAQGRIPYHPFGLFKSRD
ncbi:MAG: DMT family transporter [bacterium]|nr:DMT family transporter [bacterium]